MSAAVPGTPVTSANPNTTTNTSLSVALASTTVGDLNVITLSGLASGTGINPTVTTPSGWTKVFEQMSNSGTPSTFVATYWRFYQSGDGTAQTFSWANQGQMVASCEPFSNADTSTPVPYSTSIPHSSGAGSTYAISGTTGADPGLLVYGGANKTGTAWSNLSDNDAGQRGLSSSATMCQRITAAELAGGTAYSKTMTGSASTIGVQWAFIVKGSAAGGTAASGTASLTLTASAGWTEPGTASLTLAASATAAAPAAGSAALLLTATAGGPSTSGTAALTLSASGGAAAAGSGVGSVTLAASGAGRSALTASAALTLTASAATPIVRQLLAGGLQWPAHRNGTYATYGEETLEGYQAAVAQYSKAILEISVWDTSDGVYVCSHDQTTGRVFTGTNLTITSTSWATLSPNGSSTVGRPTTIVGGNPMRRLEEVLDAFPTGLFIVENKHGTNQSTLANLLDSRAAGRWMFKGPYNDTANANTAAGHGAPMWLYFYPSQLGSLSTTYSAVSAAGVPIVFGLGDYSTAPVPVQSDANTFFTFTTSNGLMAWAHILGTTAQRTTADGQATTAGAAFTGYMTSSYPTLAPNDSAAGTASLSLTASAATRAPAAATAALVLNASGAAPGTTATAALSLTAVGGQAAAASATAAVTLTASGSGPTAAGAASLVLAATAAGAGQPAGVASITVSAGGNLSGAPTATAALALNAAASFGAAGAGTAVLTVTAAGSSAARSTGSAALTITSAAGASSLTSGTANVSLTGSGAGYSSTAGTALLTLAGTATYRVQAAGTAVITITSTALAAGGSRPVNGAPGPAGLRTRSGPAALAYQAATAAAVPATA